jgi:hypothetical protein
MSIFERRGIVIAFLSVCLTSCAPISPHEFAEPARDWQVRSGQLLYRNPKRTLIGEVYVRFSKTGDFELTFSKGPGITLLVLRQDATFVELKGPLAGRGWSGPIDRAPQQLRGWLGLRDKLIHAQNRQSFRYSMRAEEFLFQF